MMNGHERKIEFTFWFLTKILEAKIVKKTLMKTGLRFEKNCLSEEPQVFLKIC